jgi:hypothetical protein
LADESPLVPLLGLPTKLSSVPFADSDRVLGCARHSVDQVLTFPVAKWITPTWLAKFWAHVAAE